MDINFMITKIALVSDVHSNKQALEAVLRDIEGNDCEEIINLGDSLAIGAEPVQVLNILKENNVESVLGNHDTYYLYGLDNQIDVCPVKHTGEYNHQKWTHDELGESYKEWVGGFPAIVQKTIGEKKLVCMHYPHLNDDNKPRFSLFTKEQSAEKLRVFFNMYAGDIFAFGHNHNPCAIYDEEIGRYYINPGSLGCSLDEYVSYAILSVNREKVSIEHRKVKYDKAMFISKMQEKKPPEYENVLKWFHGIDV